MHEIDQQSPILPPAAQPPGEDAGTGQDRLEGLKRKAREVVYQTPEVRPEKVAELQEAIAQGAYEVDAEKVADVLIDELLEKR